MDSRNQGLVEGCLKNKHGVGQETKWNLSQRREGNIQLRGVSYKDPLKVMGKAIGKAIEKRLESVWKAIGK